MATTVELGTGNLFLELFPASEFPSKDFELVDIVAQIWHMLCSKGIICGDDNVKILSRRKGSLRTISDRNWFIDIHHWRCTIDLLVQRLHVTLWRQGTR
jgi:hypothetical protein